MNTISAAIQAALTSLRTGNLADARAQAEAAVRATPADPAASALLGMVLCQQGEFAAAILPLRQVVKAWPQDMGSRFNLASALVASGKLDEAEGLCETAPSGDAKWQRIAGYIHQTHGRLAEAEGAYALVVAKVPQDFETWNNLGNVRADLGRIDGAIEAFERAIALRPDLSILYLNFSEQLARANRQEQRANVMRTAVASVPGDAALQVDLGLAEGANGHVEAAKVALLEALRLRPGMTAAYVELALLYEQLNEVDALAALFESLSRQGVTDPELLFVEAWSLRRQGRLVEALAVAKRLPETIEPLRRAQLIAELSERLGETDEAFAAYREMNAASLVQLRDDDLGDYRADIERMSRTVTPQWVAGWAAPIPEAAPPPVFIVGFPRSGTTLLDTLLMNMSHFHVLEELPVLSRAVSDFDDVTRLARIDPAQVLQVRRRYFEVVQEIAPPSRADQTIIDKFPLSMARIPLIHRLFPTAKIVLVERHPCDVVLSCFMANFSLNRAMRHFTTLEGAARLYDTVFDAWTKASTLLPIDCHHIRYERMVDDLEGEMRGLLSFLGVPWDSAVLDNQAAASRRTHIRTASYSQVTEPLYRRAAGRWERYRRHLEPVLPILAPWAERMGYPI